jgi:hypothetical protein
MYLQVATFHKYTLSGSEQSILPQQQHPVLLYADSLWTLYPLEITIGKAHHYSHSLRMRRDLVAEFSPRNSSANLKYVIAGRRSGINLLKQAVLCQY